MFGEHGGSTIRWIALAVLGVCLLAPVKSARAQTSSTSQVPTVATVPKFDNPLQIPDVRGALPTATDGKGVSATLQIVVVMTVLTLVPTLLVLMTSFTRIIIVLSLLRQAMATPQLPPSQVLLGLSLFMTIVVMGPTFGRVYDEAVDPYLNKGMGQREALTKAMEPLRDFMYAQIEAGENYEDIYLFEEYRRHEPIPDDETLALKDVPTSVLVPAFVLGELKTAFVMGFKVYLPFLVIDMVIASILISMGMMMLPPVLISLPFKLLLFVMADGWHLVVQSLMYSFVQPGG
ncbi:MAG: flagellar type III secretion system pore protein FliP [Phycisphaerales bacterium]|nr:flagellar type III secretion system pore protein FliP [Phycisphaerales bacterium]